MSWVCLSKINGYKVSFKVYELVVCSWNESSGMKWDEKTLLWNGRYIGPIW